MLAIDWDMQRRSSCVHVQFDYEKCNHDSCLRMYCVRPSCYCTLLTLFQIFLDVLSSAVALFVACSTRQQ